MKRGRCDLVVLPRGRVAVVLFDSVLQADLNVGEVFGDVRERLRISAFNDLLHLVGIGLI